jgi:hypothetical protein
MCRCGIDIGKSHNGKADYGPGQHRLTKRCRRIQADRNFAPASVNVAILRPGRGLGGTLTFPLSPCTTGLHNLQPSMIIIPADAGEG